MDKCSECEGVEVIIKKARKAYCGGCWKHRCEFQFRKRLLEVGKPAKGTTGEVFREKELVLISYDGSPSGVALCNLVVNALVLEKRLEKEQGASRKLPFPFKFALFVVLESDLNGSPGVEGRQKQHLMGLQNWTSYASSVTQGASFPLLTSCVEMSLLEYGSRDDAGSLVIKLGDPNSAKEHSELDQDGANEKMKQLTCQSISELSLPFNQDLDKELANLRKSLESKSEDKDFVAVLKRNILCSVAKQLNISKVILAEDQTALAVKMFSMMSLGRGCQVADEMSFTSSATEGVTFIRPLLDFSDDDLRAYLQTLEPACTEGIIAKASTKRKVKIDSVERQCDDFISNLQKGYPHTVSTLTRIGCKLESTPETDQPTTTNLCKFCKRQSDSQESHPLCYGCQHFLNKLNPEKSDSLRNMLGLNAQTS